MRRLPFLLTLLVAACAEYRSPHADGPRTVVLVSLDTLRPDRLGVYGGAPEVSPCLDALAAEGVVFDQALAPAPYTLPSHMTMLTGLDPIAHGVRGNAPLSRHVVTLAEVLQEAGYATGAFTDGGFVAARYGFDQGFDVYEDERNKKGQGPNGFARLLPPALRWLRGRGEHDVFLFLHTFDAHGPYDEGDPEVIERFRARPVEDGPQDAYLHLAGYLQQQASVGVTKYHRMGQLLNDYDAGIHEADRGVGQVVETLRETGRYDNSLLIVTSDHGESFFDRGLHVGHGLECTEDGVAIPLVVRFPGGLGAGQRHGELVGLVDLARTVLDTWDLEGPRELQGESLLSLVRGEPRQTTHLLGMSLNTSSYFLVQDGFKYITFGGKPQLTIARSALGPRTPPGLEPPASEVEYDRNGVALAYDFDGDPLALFDVIPIAEQLYDREGDEQERHNLRLDPRHATQLEALRSEFLRRYDESRELHASLRDEGEGAVAVTRNDRLVLEGLGYLGDTSSEPPPKPVARVLAERVEAPPAPPDMTAVLEADRAVHVLRARLLDGQPLGADDRPPLQAAAAGYRDWARDHPEHRARIGWRLRGVHELLGRTGDESSLEAWLDDLGVER